jgi:hypothetical protein
MTIRTRVGRSLTGDYDHFGLRVFRDLAGHTSYLGLVAFAVTGRRLSQADEAILDDLAVSSHVPEPRVWPIKLSRLGSSMGRAMPGFLCGSVALDCDLVGGRVAEHAADLLVALRAHLDYSTDDDAGIDTFLEHRDRLIGFGVPLRSVDERVVAFRACLERRGGKQGIYWRLAERLWRVVKQRRGLEVNIIGATAAVCLDLGFKPTDIVPLAAVLLQPTLLANAVAGAFESPEQLRCLPADLIRYIGPTPRESPRSIATQTQSKHPPEI